MLTAERNDDTSRQWRHEAIKLADNRAKIIESTASNNQFKGNCVLEAGNGGADGRALREAALRRVPKC